LLSSSASGPCEIASNALDHVARHDKSFVASHQSSRADISATYQPNDALDSMAQSQLNGAGMQCRQDVPWKLHAYKLNLSFDIVKLIHVLGPQAKGANIN